jgi:hypothetical protein
MKNYVKSSGPIRQNLHFIYLYLYLYLYLCSYTYSNFMFKVQATLDYPGNSGEKVMDNSKPRLKQKQSKHGTTWI